MNDTNNKTEINTINKEVRVKFSTNIPELKLKETLQSMIIKTSLNKNELVIFIKKLTKYQNKKELEIFINNKLFSHASQQLSVFLLEENISTEEQILEIFYTFSLDEPKLIDSKKQDEWIKKVKALSNDYVNNSVLGNVFSVGLFNSEINFFDCVSHDKIIVNDLSTNSNELEESDYLFLNDYCFVNSNTNSNDVLLVKAIRDYEYSFVIEELNLTTTNVTSSSKRKSSTNSNKSNNTKTAITKYSSILGGQKQTTITKLATNPLDNTTFSATTKTGDFMLYQIKNYNYSNNSSNNNKKRKNDSYRQILHPIKEIKVSDNEITAMAWLNDCFIALGDLEYIKILNSQQLSIFSLLNVNHHLVTSLDTSKEKIVISSHDNGSFKIWDINAKSPLMHNVTKAHKGFVTKIEKVSDNDALILSSGHDGVVKLWDIRKLSSCYFEFPNKNHNEKVFDFEMLNVKSKCGFNKLVSGGSGSELEFFEVDF